VLSFSSIEQKLRAVIMTTTCIVLVVVTLAFVVNEIVTYRRAIREELTALANIIGINATAAVAFGDRKSAAMTLESVRAKPHIRSAAIVLTDGTVFARYGGSSEDLERLLRPLSGGQHPAGAVRNLLAELRRRTEESVMWSGREDVVVPVSLDGQQIGMVVVTSSLDELVDRLRGFFALVVVITLIALATAFAVATRLQQPIIGPILQLVNTTRNVAALRDYRVRVAAQSRDEIGQLIAGFNEMLSQIQKRDADLERYAAELQDGNEELKSFIYSAAHDLRAPLVNIRGFTGELGRAAEEVRDIAEEHAASLPDKARRRVDALIRDDILPAMGFIGASIERMNSLISALLKLSQLGRRDLRPELLDLQDIVEASLKSLRHQIDQKKAVVEVGDLPAVTADRTAMEQIITNLLDNAVKYLSRSRPGRIVIGSRLTEQGTAYFIQDNGRGIHQDDMPKLFRIFRRLGPQDVPGEGVGLTYVKTLVKRHGGHIWCESAPDQGSTFWFTMPHRSEPQAVRG
jgi:hypothetical protein